MGLSKRLKDLSKEYMQDPRGQYFRHLEKILNLNKQSRVTDKEVFEFVRKWYTKGIYK